MEPHSLRLTGFKGIRAGMGVDEVFVDFENPETLLPEGLVAIIGKNGGGKTTLLDNMHPYRIMPYKLRDNKQWKTGAFSYYDQTFGKACKDLVWSIGGKRYRSIVQIDTERRKQTAVLSEWVEGGDEPWKALNDGQTGTYDEELEKICGSPALFFTSAFRAQEARRLSAYPKAEIIAIVSELLTIDGIKRQSEKALKVVTALRAEVTKLEGQIAEAAKVLAGLPEAGEAHKAEEVRLALVKEELEKQKTALVQAETQLRDMEVALAGKTEAKKRWEEMKDRLKGVQETKLTLETKRARLLAEADGELKRLETDMGRELQGLESERAGHARKIGELEQLVKSGDALRAVAKTLPELEQKLADGNKATELLREQWRTAQAKLTAATEASNQLKVLGTKLEGLQLVRQNRQRDLKLELERCTRQQEFLGTQDCHDDKSGWTNKNCKLLSEAVAAVEKIAKLNEELQRLAEPSAEEKGLQTQIEQGKKQLAEFGDPADEKSKAELAGKAKAEELQKLTVQRDEAQKAVLALSELDASAVRIKDLVTLCDGIVEKKKKLEESTAERRAEMVRKREASDREAGEELAKNEAAAAELKQKIAELEKSLDGDAEARIVKQRTEVEGLKRRIGDLSTQLVTVTEGVAKWVVKIEVMKKEEAKVKDIQQLIDRLNEEISCWQLIAIGCSNEGIISLEIDDAGPSISAIANDLLVACYGPRFSVRFETQQEKGDGGMKDVFDITVFDANVDEEKSIRDMSGGEVTYIEDAITRAIATFNMQRSNIVYDTLFTDEKDGALDHEKKVEFIAIKRRALEVGAHKRELFITHTPELYEQADAKIVMQPGGCYVQ